MKLSVAIVGAGAGGIISARRLLEKGATVTLFEKGPKIGGTWIHTAETEETAGHPIHSSMYDSLRTNLPKEVMQIPGVEFDKSLPSFVKHSDVLDFIEKIANQFKIGQYVELNTTVEDIARSSGKWKVITSKDKVEDTRLFDRVLVCNGHYSVPYTPPIPGLSDFPGHVSHSHSYRNNATWKGKRVVVLGAGSSGRDISQEIAEVANATFLAERACKQASDTPHWNIPGLFNRPPIKKIEKDKVEFLDGSVEDADAIVFCTGYHFTYPFLSNVGMKVDEVKHVHPLYKHVFLVSDPTLAFIGIPWKVLPFTMFDLQSQWISKVWQNEIALPSEEDMENDRQKDLEWREHDLGYPLRHAHQLGRFQWDYFRDLATLGESVFFPHIEEIYTYTGFWRSKVPCCYRKSEVTLKEDNTWTFQPPPKKHAACTAAVDRLMIEHPPPTST